MLHNLTRQLETLAQGNETYAAFNKRSQYQDAGHRRARAGFTAIGTEIGA